MKPIGVEVSSKRSLLAVMLLLPLLIAGSAWYVMNEPISVGVTQRSFLTPPDQLNASLHRTLEGLDDFFYQVSEVQKDVFTKGLRVLLLGVFIGITLVSSLVLIRPLSDGTVAFEIGLVRNKKRVLLYRTAPIIVYTAYVSMVLALFAYSVFPLKVGLSFDIGKLLWLSVVLFLSGLWGVALTALTGFYTREPAYPLVVSFLVSLASFTGAGDLLFPYYRLLNALWVDVKLLNTWSIAGLGLLFVSAFLALHRFERGEYY
ncbi:hypothetical protein [Thermococcus sp. AM4]|uniref:hypothetical protein n=1 Tax=Thermococcus sp. (strain AM4) TaxID=246969 RepID=UPI000186FD24|nr:hypothetical protein [Thermococcus sp. AM4]EEB74836.1 conserved hypothetical protein [Thermococcus sp. AM4]